MENDVKFYLHTFLWYLIKVLWRPLQPSWNLLKVPQRSVRINIYVNFYFLPGTGTGRIKRKKPRTSFHKQKNLAHDWRWVFSTNFLKLKKRWLAFISSMKHGRNKVSFFLPVQNNSNFVTKWASLEIFFQDFV